MRRTLLALLSLVAILPTAADAEILTAEALDELLSEQLAQHSVKDAVAHAVALSGRPRREVYARALELAKQIKDGHGQD